MLQNMTKIDLKLPKIRSNEASAVDYSEREEITEETRCTAVQEG